MYVITVLILLIWIESDCDGDELGDVCDDDADNDGALNDVDSDDCDVYVCSDNDNDGCDDCSNGSFNEYDDGLDIDVDGICDLGDNCVNISNFDQLDTDSDMVGDECDNCTFTSNPSQLDSDLDTFGDMCDICLNGDDRYDSDDDGVPNDCDFERDLLGEKNNLVSFYAIPDDNSLESMFNWHDCNFSDLISDGEAAKIIIDDIWFGSLDHIEPGRGYWLKSDSLLTPSEDCLDSYEITGNFMGDVVYELDFSNNLVSYPYSSAITEVSDLNNLCDNGDITAFITQGKASMCIDNEFMGSLQYFEPGYGYWIRVENESGIEFTYPEPGQNDLTRKIVAVSKVPNEFSFSQSTKQAFYFIEDISFESNDIITRDDWIIAYNNGSVIGARQWSGKYTDIPAMGNDQSNNTLSYALTGSVPSFKVFKSSTGELIDMAIINIPEWQDMANICC